MTFNLSLTGSDLLLLLPEILLTLWLCVILSIDFSMRNVRHETLAYLSIGGFNRHNHYPDWVRPI